MERHSSTHSKFKKNHVDRALIDKHVTSDEFKSRAEIAKRAAGRFMKFQDEQISPEWEQSLNLVDLCLLISKQRGYKKIKISSSLSSAWDALIAVGSVEESIDDTPDLWLLDLYCLYFEPSQHLDYRRILAALRRLSFCVGQYDSNLLKNYLSAPLNSENSEAEILEEKANETAALKSVEHHLFRSYILMPKKAFPQKSILKKDLPLPSERRQIQATAGESNI